MGLAFATTQDLGARLGREFSTDAQTEQAEMLLDLASSAIADAMGLSLEEAESLGDQPKVWWVVCIECAARALSTPAGARSTQETLGQYSRSTTYSIDAADAGVMLTDREKRMVQRAVYGSTSGSARVPSIADDLWCS